MTGQEKKKIADPKNVTDAVEVAEDAGLRYVSDDQPGYTRKAKGDDFEYFEFIHLIRASHRVRAGALTASSRNVAFGRIAQDYAV